MEPLQQVYSWLFIYVDDVLFTGTDSRIHGFKSFLAGEYKLKMPGETRRFCGINISRDGDLALVDQMDYIEKLTKTFGVLEARKVWTPMTEVPPQPTQDPPDDSLPYRSIVGSLLFLVTQTRPELSYSVGVLERYNHCFQDDHFQAAKRVLRCRHDEASIVGSWSARCRVSYIDCIL